MPVPEPNEEPLRRAKAALRDAKRMAWTWVVLRRASIFLTLLIIPLALYVGGMHLKELVVGRSHTYHFSNVPSPHRTRAEFEAEFAKRLVERGYQVEKVRVTHEWSDRKFDGEIILVNVPANTADSALWLSVHEVMSSLGDKGLPLER